jgi:hypothetical protein
MAKLRLLARVQLATLLLQSDVEFISRKGLCQRFVVQVVKEVSPRFDSFLGDSLAMHADAWAVNYKLQDFFLYLRANYSPLITP